MTILENKSNDTKLVFVVEDEPDILELESLHLKKAGYLVETFPEAKPMLARLEKGESLPDLLLLDLMMPGMDGLEVCKAIKKEDQYAHIPIIMVTAKTEELDVVLGLELGADDYIPKPFSPRELVARVKAVLRRGLRNDKKDSVQITIGDTLTIIPDKYEVLVSGKQVQLTSTEFMILKMLAAKKGWVFSREKILDRLWGDEKDVYDRTVDVHIKNLRDKLGSAGKMIKNVRGVGYKIEDS
jgi:DNA-binding response OmpR family regulator